MEEKRVEETAMELPAGFRFHPTDEELISYYLYPKVLDSKFSTRAIGDVDLNKCEPWELPKMAKMGEEKELYFFCVRDRKYPTGMRTNRATESGYWKATGKDKEIIRGKSSLVGMKKTLVFYKGRAPKGEKSNWVMHEFRLEGILSSQYLPSSSKHEWVICRVFEKSNNSNGVGGKKNFSYSESQLRMRMKSEEDDQLLGDDEDDSSSFEFNQSSSLPPLMDPSSPPPPSLSYYHTSKLPSIGPVSVTHDDNQYVSCFSNNMINPLNHYRYQYCDPYHIDTGPHFNNNFTNPYPSYLSQSKHNYNTSYPIRGAAAAAAGAGNSSSSSSQYPSFDAVSKHDILIRSILDGNSGDHMPSAGAHNINRDIFREGGVTTTATTMSVSQDTCLSTDIINREISSSSYQMISSCGGGSLLNRENQEEEEEGPSTSDCGGGGLIDIDSFWSY